MAAVWRYAQSFTGFERDARIFLVTTLIYGIALSLWWVDFNLYLTALGFDPAFIGISGTVGSAAGVLVAFPASILSDRLGRRIILAVGAAGSTFAIAGLIVVTSPLAILALAAAMGAGSQTFFVLQSPFLMEHSQAENRSELFSLQSAVMPITNVGAALLGSAIALIVGSVAGVASGDPAVFRVLLLVMAIAAGAATVSIFALRDDRPRPGQTLPSAPFDASVEEPIESRSERPPLMRRVRLAIPRPADPSPSGAC